MSRNFELLRQNRKDPEILTPVQGGAIGEAARERFRPAEAPPEVQSDWQRGFGVVVKHWRSSLMVAGAVFVVVALYTFIVRPEYEPVARLEIDPPGAETFSMQQQPAGLAESQYLATQAQELQSDDLAIAIIRELHLAQNADFVKPGKTRGAVVTGTDNAPALSPAENIALREFRPRLKVTRDPVSRVVTVAFVAHDAQLAATITNRLAQLYIERSFKTRHDAIMQSEQWLSRQLDDVRDKMQESNRKLAEFQQATGVWDVDDTRNTFGDQMSELNKQLTQSQSDRIQLEAFLNRVKENGADSLPQVRDNLVVQKLTQELADVRAQLSQTQVIYGAKHPNTQKLQSQVDELEKQLAAQRREILDQLRTSYAAARARENLMNGQMKGASKQMSEMAQYNALKKEALADAQLYNQLLEKVKEAGIAAASKSSNIRVVDDARILDRPTRPRKALNLAAGLFLGLISGVVLAFVREGFDRRLHTPDDIKRWTGISAISIIPVAGRNGYSGLLGGLKLLSTRRPNVAGAPKFLLDRPRSAEAEAVRGLHTGIMLSRPGRPPQALLITSSLPGEGKTTLAVNLAITLSQHGRTCLVDADLRRPCVAKAFGLNGADGLGEILQGTAALENVLVGVQDAPNLSILPAGPAVEDRGQLVCTESMQAVVRDLRSRFEFVVIDSPPILPYADGRALSNMADGVIFVGRSGFTPKDAMVRSMELLAEVNSAPILEVVLNAADYFTRDYRYYRYGYDKQAA